MKRDHKEIYGVNSYNSGSSSSKVGSSSSIVNLGKGKLWEEDQDVDAMDELLIDLGYKVRSSNMSDVAQKLEQLEMIMGTAQEDEISHLASDTVHYNSSDIFGWDDNILIEMKNSTSTTNFDPVSKNHKQIVYNDDSEYDLRVIPGVDVYPPKSNPNSDPESTCKRIKTSIGSSASSISGAVTESPKKTNIPVFLVNIKSVSNRLL